MDRGWEERHDKANQSGKESAGHGKCDELIFLHSIA